MAPHSSHISSRCLCQRFRNATSSSWTTCKHTSSPACAMAIEAVGAKQRFLPAYSPDLNPIENAYAKIKSDLRKGAARAVDALWKLAGRSVKAIAPSECAGYFTHAGYRA